MEAKELLFKDLSARLPYGVKAQYYGSEEEMLIVDTIEAIYAQPSIEIIIGQYVLEIEDIKPYLRPMSSMTEEEQKILEDFGVTISPFSGQMHIPFDEIEFPFITMQKIISYLYSIHIDINGLIPKGLAIEVTEENNPYK